MLELLTSLGAAGQQLRAVPADTHAQRAIINHLRVTPAHLTEVMELSPNGGSSLWQQARSQKLAMSDVAFAFASVIELSPEDTALTAAALSISLLNTQGCPVLSLFDRFLCGAFLKLLRNTVASFTTSKKKAPKHTTHPPSSAPDTTLFDAADTDHDADAVGSRFKINCERVVTQCLQAFSQALPLLALRDQPETVRAIAEACADITISHAAPVAIVDAAYDVSMALLSRSHGAMRELSALVFRLLTPHLLGALGIKRGGGAAPRRAALAFLRQVLSERKGCEEAAAALARHVLLRAPDRVEGRTASAEVAIELLRALLSTGNDNKRHAHLYAFVVFLAKLSRTAKPNQRQVAVDTAAALLFAYKEDDEHSSAGIGFPPPYEIPTNAQKETTQRVLGTPTVPPTVLAIRRGVTRPGDQSTTPYTGGKRPTPLRSRATNRVWAPWGTVCLAIIAQRASDRSPAVRARALAALATVLTNHLSTGVGSSILDAKKFNAAVSLSLEIDLRVDTAAVAGFSSDGKRNEVKALNRTKVPGSSGGEDDENDGTASITTARTPATIGNRTPLGLGGENSIIARTTGGRALSTGERTSTAPTEAENYDPVLAAISYFTLPAGWYQASLNTEALVNLDSLHGLARRRCGDDKSHVRKAAVSLVQALILVDSESCFIAQDVAALRAATLDALMSVRKAALLSIGSLAVALPLNSHIAASWVETCLPLARDPEAAIQEVVFEQFVELILERAIAIAAAGDATRKTTMREENDELIAPMETDDAESMNTSGGGAIKELVPLLRAVGRAGAPARTSIARCCSQLRSKGRLVGAHAKKATKGLEHILLSGPVGRTTTQGLWMVYAELATVVPSAPSWGFLEAQWMALLRRSSERSDTDDIDTSGELLRVIAASAAEFPPDRAAALCLQLRKGLEGLSLSPPLSAAHVTALAQLTQVQCTKESMVPETSMEAWVLPLISVCEDSLVAGFNLIRQREWDSPHSNEVQKSKMIAALFLTGELALLRSARVPSRLVTLVQALTSPTLAPELDACSGGGASAHHGGGAPAAIESSGSARVPPALQALAWVTLGKLCLVDESLAKKCMPLFVQELGRARSAAVRNNIVVALADLVVHYTGLVDAHVPRLAACLLDPNELVRAQALGLLANLLQKDYVKWRGALFHRFVLALVDDSERVAAMAERLLGETLTSKLPNLAYNHYVETMFVLNECAVGLTMGAAAMEAEEAVVMPGHMLGGGAFGREFSLKGSHPEARAKRDAIYQKLLRKMVPEHKFATAARLCQEILGGAADGALPLNEPSAAEVVRDALHVLSCSDIVAIASKSKAPKTDDLEEGGNPEDDPTNGARAVLGAARGRLVSQLMKKHLVEGVVPVVIELKRTMEAAKHPLLGDLMAAAAAMLKDHTAEIEDILAADRQLAKEILYDLRRAEEKAREEALRKEGTHSDEDVAGPRQPKDDDALPVGKTPVSRKADDVNPVYDAPGWKTPASRSTPKSKGKVGKPAGTSGATPIAVEVLRNSGVHSLATTKANAGTPTTNVRPLPTEVLKAEAGHEAQRASSGLHETVRRWPFAADSPRSPNVGILTRTIRGRHLHGGPTRSRLAVASGPAPLNERDIEQGVIATVSRTDARIKASSTCTERNAGMVPAVRMTPRLRRRTSGMPVLRAAKDRGCSENDSIRDVHQIMTEEETEHVDLAFEVPIQGEGGTTGDTRALTMAREDKGGRTRHVWGVSTAIVPLENNDEMQEDCIHAEGIGGGDGVKQRSEVVEETFRRETRSRRKRKGT